MTRPAAMITSSSTSASTSCITWLDSSTQRPCARSSRSQSRRCRVAMTSRPLVGSSSSRCCGSCTSARASATFVRSPCEKPFALRSAIAPRSSRSISASTRAASGCLGEPVQPPVVLDVLARRELLVEPRAVRQHAERPPRGERIRGEIECRRRALRRYRVAARSTGCAGTWICRRRSARADP